MANFLLKLKLVIWKNCIIRKRHWILSTFEILMSVLIFALLGYTRTLIPSFNKMVVNETTYAPLRHMQSNNWGHLFYAPNYTEIQKIFDSARDTDNLYWNLTAFANEDDLLEYIQARVDENHYFMKPTVVIFDEFPRSGLPNKLKYRIRQSSYIPVNNLFDNADPFEADSKNYYFYSSFLEVQKAIDLAFIRMTATGQKKTVPPFDLTLQEMPYPPHTNNGPLAPLFLTVLPSCTILAFILVFPSVLKRVIEEKSTGIKELMKMMGLESWMLWLGWFLHSMATNIIAISFIVIMLFVGMDTETQPIIEYGSWSILWIFIFLYCSAGICFCFTISTLFKKPTLGMCVGMMIWIVTFFIVNPLVTNDDPNEYAFLRKFIMILPNVCLVYGFKAMNEFEKKEIGLTWSHFMDKPNNFTPHPSMAFVCLMLIIDCFIFTILTWYIENVFPGEYGISKPWYFPFTKSYWCANKIENIDENVSQVTDRDEIEEVPGDFHAGVQIRNLSKTFQKKKAVDNLSFDIYDNQITVLLGHNGAGKTTTMNIITGMLAPTNGSAIVNGYNIRTNINKVRESLGLCPQHNLQFSDLTVLEHLMFFAMLKGHSKAEAKEESLKFLSRLNISSKANKMASALSGGMRRKLSLGMALVGNTRVLMLDEPTSGMDPEARREIWDFLLSMRGERTILITTHYMEEADILGDRIAIMHHGQLMCYGTSLFLKKHYGTGYTLSLLVSPTWNINALTEAIQAFVPTATVKNISAGCVTFVLPTNDTTALSKLFLNIENNKHALCISNFSVSITTMEEVFLRVGEIAEEDAKKSQKNSDADSEKCLLADNYTENPEHDLIQEPVLLMLQQFMALFLKRLQYTLHRWVFFLIQIGIPVVLVIFIMVTMKLEETSAPPDVRRDLRLSAYVNTKTFYSNVKETESIGDFYAQNLRDQNLQVTKRDQVSDAIVAVGKNNLDDYNRGLIVGAEFNFTANNGTMVYNGMFGNWAIHGPPITLNLITNAFLKSVMNDATYSIDITNNPLPEIRSKAQDSVNISSILMWMFQFPTAFIIMIGFFLIFPQEEHLTGVKHLQIMAGVFRPLYWLSQYIFDVLVYIFVGVIVVIILVSFDSGGPFGNAESLQALCSIMFLYGFGVLPFAYLFTYRPTASSSMTCLIWIQIIFGTIGTVAVIVLQLIGDEYETAGNAIFYIFGFIPNFAFSNGIYHYTTHASELYQWDNMDADIRKVKCLSDPAPPCCIPKSDACAAFKSYYQENNSIATNLYYLLAHIFIYWALLLFIDYGVPRKIFEKILGKIYNIQISDQTNLDEDVEDEKKRIISQINKNNRISLSNNTQNGINQVEETDVLQVSNLRKYFGKFYAVRGLNFGVKSSECFGLLGINGAGKTTTFKMLTGDTFPTTGYANIHGFPLEQEKSAYLKKIGYCPQFDALNLKLTCKQMLVLFALLRGIPSRRVKMHVDKWLSKFGIKQYENIRCGNLSGGNKRKLSTAIALIGNPPLVMLDEPTSGVDPVARRNLWDILAVLRKSGQSIILTSHSMDECEALCDRLAIMVDGQMKCIGNIQYLKQKFGQGFTVMMKLKATVMQGEDTIDSASELNSIKSTIESKYTCTLKDEHTGMLLYHVTNPDAKLGELFDFMEKLKGNKDILEDYTVSDTSLEQVFLSFAKEKIQDTGNVTRTAAAAIV